jgi:predicted HTH domain antitoxin
MTLETVTTRLPQETLDEIEAIAKKEQVDRSELIRRLLDAALRQRRVDEAANAYRDGKVTLWRASEMAGLTLRGMMDVVKDRKILVPYSVEDLDRDLEYVMHGKSG